MSLLSETLLAKRQEKGLLIADIARQLNLRATVLEAIEHQRYDLIGAPVYVRAFVRRYAMFLGVNDQWVNGELDSLLQPHNKTLQVQTRETEEIQTKRRSFLALYSFIIIMLAVGSGSYFWPIVQKDHEIDESASLLKDIIATAIVTDTSQNALANLPKKEHDQDKVVLAEGSEIISVLEENNHELNFEETHLSQANHLIPFDNNHHSLQQVSNLLTEKGLLIEVEQECWVEILSADGKKLLYALLRPDQSYHVEGLEPFRIKVGNAQGIKHLSLNGQPVAESIYRPNKNTNVHRFVIGETVSHQG